jgi:hypothetical protein
VAGRPKIRVTRVLPNVLPLAWTSYKWRRLMSLHKRDAEAMAPWMLSDRGPPVRGSVSLDGDAVVQRIALLMMCSPG